MPEVSASDDQEWDPFERDLLKWILQTGSGVSRRQVDAALTALLLFVHPTRTVRASVRAGIASGCCAIDGRLLQTLLRNAPRTIRLRAACTAAAREATAQVFDHLYRSAVAGGRLTRNQRLLAACALEGRLNFWPSEAEDYAADVRSLLRDPDVDVALHAIPSMAKLPGLRRKDIDRLVQLLGKAKPRLSALSALNTILGTGTYAVSELGRTFWKKIERLVTTDDQWVSAGARRLLSLRPRPV